MDLRACLADDTIALSGTLRNRVGAVVTFGDRLEVCASYSVEFGEWPADFDPSWNKDRN